MVEAQIVAWVREHETELREEYIKFTDKTKVQMPFDNFCQHAFWQPPFTMKGAPAQCVTTLSR